MSRLYSDRTYSTNLQLVERLIGNRVTTGYELSNLAKKLFGSKFLGVYDWKDKMPHLKVGDCIIVNKKSNEHWIGTANVGGTIYTYDSFGRPDYIGGHVDGDEDGEPDQIISEQNCGARVLSWLVSVLSHS